MGILNVTPDSFSDGGKHKDPQLAVEAAHQMEADGAGIIDIGGESTRPYSDPVDVQAELDRVIPVIQRLAGKLTIPISIDTSKSVVARAAVVAGVGHAADLLGQGTGHLDPLIGHRVDTGLVGLLYGLDVRLGDRPATHESQPEPGSHLGTPSSCAADSRIEEAR